MIPKTSRVQILKAIFGGFTFTQWDIRCISNNWTVADADCLISTFDYWVDPDCTPLHIPTWPSTLYDPTFTNVDGLNDHNEGEIDSPLVDFTCVTPPSSHHIYGVAIHYQIDNNYSTQYLYGFARFADPIAIAVAGDHAKFYVNVYSDNFVPLGHL